MAAPKFTLALPDGPFERDAVATLGQEIARTATELKRAVTIGALVGTAPEFLYKMQYSHGLWVKRLINFGLQSAVDRLQQFEEEAKRQLQAATATVMVAQFAVMTWSDVGLALQGTNKPGELWDAFLASTKETAKNAKAFEVPASQARSVAT